MKLEKVVYSLQNDVGNIRDGMESLKSIVVDKVEEMKCQLTAQSAELADMKGRMSIVYWAKYFTFKNIAYLISLCKLTLENDKQM